MLPSFLRNTAIALAGCASSTLIIIFHFLDGLAAVPSPSTGTTRYLTKQNKTQQQQPGVNNKPKYNTQAEG